jgi:hypothetical protein
MTDPSHPTVIQECTALAMATRPIQYKKSMYASRRIRYTRFTGTGRHHDLKSTSRTTDEYLKVDPEVTSVVMAETPEMIQRVMYPH